MIGRMILHGIAAALVVGALGFGWQALASGGSGGASNANAGLVAGDSHGSRHDD